MRVFGCVCVCVWGVVGIPVLAWVLQSFLEMKAVGVTSLNFGTGKTHKLYTGVY